MIKQISNALKRIFGFLSGIPWESEDDIPEKALNKTDSSSPKENGPGLPGPRSSEKPLPKLPVPEESIAEAPIAVVSGLPDIEQIIRKWNISTHRKPPFEKVGRIYREDSVLMIYSEVDRRGFSIDLDAMSDILDGETGTVVSLDDGRQSGTARLSVSGRAVNFRIDPFFYTTPLKSLVPILEGKKRKAPLFVGREQVEPDETKEV